MDVDDQPDPRLTRRDHALLLVAVQTGLRVSELTGLTCADVVLGTGAHVHCVGKGRRERRTPHTKQAVAVLRVWMNERQGDPDDPLFPSRRRGQLSRDAVKPLVTKYVAAARQRCPSLSAKAVSPHVLRHTAAMQLLAAGIDTSVIALWLGHAGIEATSAYTHADLAAKERTLARTTPSGTRPGRYRAPDGLLSFLDTL